MEAELSARKPEWRRRPSRAAAGTAMPSADRANGMSIHGLQTLHPTLIVWNKGNMLKGRKQRHFKIKSTWSAFYCHIKLILIYPKCILLSSKGNRSCEVKINVQIFIDCLIVHRNWKYRIILKKSSF